MSNTSQQRCHLCSLRLFYLFVVCYSFFFESPTEISVVGRPSQPARPSPSAWRIRSASASARVRPSSRPIVPSRSQTMSAAAAAAAPAIVTIPIALQSHTQVRADDGWTGPDLLCDAAVRCGCTRSAALLLSDSPLTFVCRRRALPSPLPLKCSFTTRPSAVASDS